MRLICIAPLWNSGAAWLLRDEFWTDESVPLTSPHACEPGPGQWTLNQADGALSITSGRLAFAPQSAPAWPNQAVYRTAVNRQAGRACVFRVRKSDTSSQGPKIGFMSNTSSMSSSALLWFTNSGEVRPTNPYRSEGGEAYSANQAVTAAVILRAAGGAFFASCVEGSPDWLLNWVTDQGTYASNYPGLCNWDGAGEVEFFRVVDLAGEWLDDFGVVTSRVDAPAAGETCSALADALVGFTWTPGAGEVLNLMMRRTDDSNTWIGRADQAAGTFKLIEKVGGVETERASASQSWVVGTPVRLVALLDGQSLRLYVDGTRKLTATTASFNQTATSVKVNLAGSNLFTWPRRLEGAAAALLRKVSGA